MAAATVAAAFLTFVFTDFKGIAELGIIAGGGIVICVIATFTVLPAMLVRAGEIPQETDLGPGSDHAYNLKLATRN